VILLKELIEFKLNLLSNLLNEIEIKPTLEEDTGQVVSGGTWATSIDSWLVFDHVFLEKTFRCQRVKVSIIIKRVESHVSVLMALFSSNSNKIVQNALEPIQAEPFRLANHHLLISSIPILVTFRAPSLDLSILRMDWSRVEFPRVGWLIRHACDIGRD
jgi:hypothetical protein